MSSSGFSVTSWIWPPGRKHTSYDLKSEWQISASVLCRRELPTITTLFFLLAEVVLKPPSLGPCTSCCLDCLVLWVLAFWCPYLCLIFSCSTAECLNIVADFSLFHWNFGDPLSSSHMLPLLFWPFQYQPLTTLIQEIAKFSLHLCIYGWGHNRIYLSVLTLLWDKSGVGTWCTVLCQCKSLHPLDNGVSGPLICFCIVCLVF